MKLEGVIYCGDNLYWMSRLPDEFVDLCYIDPPFFSQKHYEVIFGDGEERRSFEDRWKGGIENYIGWMCDRVKEIHRLLKPTGSFYLHCDWHASHYLKVMCDEIFGSANFLGEVIWAYGTPSGGRTSGKKPIKGHDNILVYAKEYGKHIYNIQYLPYREQYIEDWFRYTDAEGRRYRKRWRGKGVVEKQYLDESKGMPLSTLWEIPQLYANPQTYKPDRLGKQELLGYPTQKPEALLERIIKASSNPWDLVFDCFCACGTTLVAAQTLGRR